MTNLQNSKAAKTCSPLERQEAFNVRFEKPDIAYGTSINRVEFEILTANGRQFRNIDDPQDRKMEEI